MKLPSKYRFIDENIQKAYGQLAKGDEQEKELFKQIEQALKKIEEDAFCGIQIQKRLIPKEYIQKYEVRNLGNTTFLKAGD